MKVLVRQKKPLGMSSVRFHILHPVKDQAVCSSNVKPGPNWKVQDGGIPDGTPDERICQRCAKRKRATYEYYGVV